MSNGSADNASQSIQNDLRKVNRAHKARFVINTHPFLVDIRDGNINVMITYPRLCRTCTMELLPHLVPNGTGSKLVTPEKYCDKICEKFQASYPQMFRNFTTEFETIRTEYGSIQRVNCSS